MLLARFVFLPDLPFFLAPGNQDGLLDIRFKAGQTLKHLAESSGVPHTEIGQLTRGDQTVGFDYLVQDGDLIKVFPASAANSPPPDEARFILDSHLGRLAAYLRMLGFDTIYRNNFDDEELARIADQEDRILISRDRRLLMRKIVRHGYCPRSLDSYQQASEVLRRFDLAARAAPFRRCLRCNELLAPVPKTAVLDQLEPLTKQYYHEFHRCPACGQIYWKGSHYEHMQALLQSLRQDGSEQPLVQG